MPPLFSPHCMEYIGNKCTIVHVPLIMSFCSALASTVHFSHLWGEKLKIDFTSRINITKPRLKKKTAKRIRKVFILNLQISMGAPALVWYFHYFVERESENLFTDTDSDLSDFKHFIGVTRTHDLTNKKGSVPEQASIEINVWQWRVPSWCSFTSLHPTFSTKTNHVANLWNTSI